VHSVGLLYRSSICSSRAFHCFRSHLLISQKVPVRMPDMSLSVAASPVNCMAVTVIDRSVADISVVL
jgi:hypothetical protein